MARTLERPHWWGRPVACDGLSGRLGGLRAPRSLRGCPTPSLATFPRFLAPKANGNIHAGPHFGGQFFELVRNAVLTYQRPSIGVSELPDSLLQLTAMIRKDGGILRNAGKIIHLARVLLHVR